MWYYLDLLIEFYDKIRQNKLWCKKYSVNYQYNWKSDENGKRQFF